MATGARPGRCWEHSGSTSTSWMRPCSRSYRRACPRLAVEESWRMDDSGSGGDKVFGRFTEQAHRVLDLARNEAERAGHRYLGPEHVLLGLLADGPSRAAGVLGAHGVELAAARVALARLAERGRCRRRGPVTPSCWGRSASTWRPSGATPSTPS